MPTEGRARTDSTNDAVVDESATLRPPRAVLDIADRLEQAGFETWCVGGAIRDALLGHQHSDWDLATAATPNDVMRLFPRRTIPVGIAHGTVGVLDEGKVLHEVTTFRRDVRTDGRHATVEFGASLDEDLARRDFTINAIAYSPSRRRLYDPFEGRADLARRIVRAVGDPADRMREDRLRALRALRFASRFDFAIDPATWEAIVASAPALTQLSPERVKEELTKTMEQIDRPSRALGLWRDSGALGVLIPVLAQLDSVAIATLDCLARPTDGGGGSRAVARAQARRLARLSALFIGLSDGQIRAALKGLRFSNADTDWIARIGVAWTQVARDVEWTLLSTPVVADATVRRWVALAGRGRMAFLLRIGAARWAAVRAAGGPAPAAAHIRALYRRAIRSEYHDAIELIDLAVNGDDLAEAGIPRGPLIGKTLLFLLTEVLADQTLNVRDRLLSLAKRSATDGSSRPE